MKITKQLIAAASFSLLLFAPLAQAQADPNGDTRLAVVGPALTIAATDMEFGTVKPGAANANLVLSCTASPQISAFGSSATFDVAKGAASGRTSCGVISVDSIRDVSYNLTLDTTVLTSDANSDDTVSPVFTVRLTNGDDVAGLTDIDAGGSGTTATPHLISTGGRTYYILGGTAKIATDQGSGVYSGRYTISAVVQ